MIVRMSYVAIDVGVRGVAIDVVVGIVGIRIFVGNVGIRICMRSVGIRIFMAHIIITSRIIDVKIALESIRTKLWSRVRMTRTVQPRISII